jgi:hypothetical protein
MRGARPSRRSLTAGVRDYDASEGSRSDEARDDSLADHQPGETAIWRRLPGALSPIREVRLNIVNVDRLVGHSNRVRGEIGA